MNASVLTMIVAPLRQVLHVRLQRRRVHGHEHVGRVAGREDVVVGEVDLEARDAGSEPAGARISAGKSGSVERSLPRSAVSLAKRPPVSCMPSPESPGEADDDPIALLDGLLHLCRSGIPHPEEAAPMTYVPADDRYDRMLYRRSGRSGLDLPGVSLGLWQNFGARPSARDEPGDRAPRVRPRHHPLRPGQQLRPAVRLGRGELRPAARVRPRRPTATSWSSRPRPATTCGPGPTASGARASTCSPASTRACAAWASTTSTSSTRTASTRTRRSRRRWARSPSAVQPGQGALRRHLLLLGGEDRARPRRSCATSARRCSSTSRRTRCSTAGSSPTSSTCSASEGIGCIAFSPLAQGMLTDKYLDGDPGGLARDARGRLALAASC